MVYRNVSLENFIEYFYEIENIHTVYSVLKELGYDEFLGFVLTQRNIYQSIKYFENNITAFQNIVDAILIADSGLREKYAESNSECKSDCNDVVSNHIFQTQFSIASKIHISIKSTDELIKSYEKEMSTLACDMSIDQLMEMINRSDNRTTSTMYTNLIRPLRSYIKSQIDMGLSSFKENRAKNIDAANFDISNNIKKYCFANRESVKQFLYNVLPDIKENSHYNRVFLAACLAYDGVDVGDILNLRESDLVGNEIHYNGRKILLDDDEMFIINQWKCGWYYVHPKSKKQTPILQNDLLVKSHNELNGTYFGNSLRYRCELENLPAITMTDIKKSGEYFRYVFCADKIERSHIQDDMFENDVVCWKKAFGYN